LKSFVRHRGWLIVAVTVLLCFVVRVRLRDMALEGDEGEYAYAGQLMLQGVPPYKAAYNMKLPGTYAAYAIIMAVFGQTPAGIHVGVALINAASIVLMFLIGRRLLDEITGAVAAVSYGLLSLSPSVLGLAGHATHFVVLPALIGIWLLMVAVQGAKSKVQSVSQEAAERTEPEEGQSAGPPSRQSSPSVGLAPLGFIKSLPDRLAANRSATLALSGLFFGVSFLMKQHGVFFGVFAGLYLLWCRLGPLITEREPRHLRHRHRSRSRQASRLQVQVSVFDLVPFSLAFCLPYALTCLLLLFAGVFPQFWFWTVSYAGKYASTVPVVYGPDLLKNALDVVIGPNLLFWVLAGLGVAWLFWEERFVPKETKKTKPLGTQIAGIARRAEPGGEGRTADDASEYVVLQKETKGTKPEHSETPRLANFQTPSPLPSAIALNLLFLLCSFASVSVGFHYRSHYFITLLPVLALLTGVAVSHAIYLLQRVKTLELFLALPVPILLVVGILWNLAGNGPIWFTLPPDVAKTAVYHSTADQEAARIASYIRQNSQPSTPNQRPTTIAVVGSEPEIYFLSHRRSATGYLYMFPLMEVQPYALKMQEEMIAQIETNQPEYVVYANDDLSWLKWSRSELRILDWWKNYWPENLDLVETFPIKEQYAESLWQKAPDPKPARNGDGSPKGFLVFRRKAELNR
jgi:hypothetical protein